MERVIRRVWRRDSMERVIKTVWRRDSMERVIKHYGARDTDDVGKKIGAPVSGLRA
jgi:hypothetical protein